MLLQICLSKEVANTQEAETLFNVVTVRLQDHPEIDIRGSVSNHFPREEVPPDDG